jgi:hypothetical protein
MSVRRQLAMWIVVLGALSMLAQTCGGQRTAHSQEAPPSDLSAIWATPPYAHITWTQTSSATYICLSKNAHGNGILIGCWSGAAGAHKVIFANPVGSNDAAVFPAWGDEYSVEEWRETAGGWVAIGRSNRARLLARRWLALIRR